MPGHNRGGIIVFKSADALMPADMPTDMIDTIIKGANQFMRRDKQGGRIRLTAD
jgi:hypothetical protein